MTRQISNGVNNKTSILRLAIILVLAAALIFFMPRRTTNTLQSWSFMLMRPLVSFSDSAARAVSGAKSVFSPDNAPAIIQENMQLKVAVFEKEKLQDEVLRLRQALSFAQDRKLALLGSRVLLFQRDLGKEFLIVDQGKKSAVAAGYAALDKYGVLVGTAVEVNDDFSKIEIASNPGRNFEIEFIPGNTRAFAKGVGGKVFSIELVPNDSPIKQGDFAAAFVNGGRISFLLAEVSSDKSSPNSPFKEIHAVMLSRPEQLAEVFMVIP